MAAAKAIKAEGQGRLPGLASPGSREHMYLPTIWQAGGRDRHPGRRDVEVARSTRRRRRRRSTTTRPSTRTGLDPKAAVGWEEPDAQTAFVNGDVAMLIAGGWTYNSIIATKPELEKKIGTELTPAGPSGKGTAFAGGSHLVQFQESKNQDLGAAFIDFMLEPGAAEQVHERDRLPAGHDRRHQGLGLPRGPAAQAVRRAAARPQRGLPAVAQVGRPGGREHLRR